MTFTMATFGTLLPLATSCNILQSLGTSFLCLRDLLVGTREPTNPVTAWNGVHRVLYLLTRNALGMQSQCHQVRRRTISALAGKCLAEAMNTSFCLTTSCCKSFMQKKSRIFRGWQKKCRAAKQRLSIGMFLPARTPPCVYYYNLLYTII